jgi:lysophospholipase L1-like esterase
MLQFLRRLVARYTGTVHRPAPRKRARRAPLNVEALGDRLLPSATPLRLAVMGDSLSASYAGQPYGAAGDLSWVQQLQNLDGKRIVLHDEAFAGATSNSLLHSEGGHAAQVPAVVDLIHHHQIDAAVLLIGANDIDQDLPLLATDPAKFVSTFVTTVVTNIETAASAVTAAGHVRLVIGNVPDVTVTPGFLSAVPAAAVPVVEQAIQLADQQIDAFAVAHHIPVVDMYGLTHILNTPVTMGGVQVTNLYAPDFFHPNTVGQGILADTVLDAFHEGYDLNVRRLRLSDQQILAEAHIAHKPGRTFFDVDPFVLANEDRHEYGFHFRDHDRDR